MELIRGIHNIKDCHKGCVLTIGNFDGVHLGHQTILQQVKTKAKELNLPSMVMLFEPQPNEFFLNKKAASRITNLRDKCCQLKKFGIDRVLCVKFDQKFAENSAKHFISYLLCDQLGVKFLVVGDDFKFGYRQAGDFEYLRSNSVNYNFTVIDTKPFLLNSLRVSSTKIRAALETNQLDLANKMLGRSYSISGRVAHGRKLGRKLGFPTANIPLYKHKLPVSGVFAVEVICKELNYKKVYGVANIGLRPTVKGISQQLEVNIFDFNYNLYGMHLEVILRYKLRDEVKFASLKDLQQQITLDAAQARALLQ